VIAAASPSRFHESMGPGTATTHDRLVRDQAVVLPLHFCRTVLNCRAGLVLPRETSSSIREKCGASMGISWTWRCPNVSASTDMPVAGDAPTTSYASATSPMSTTGHVSAASPMSTAGHVSAASPMSTAGHVSATSPMSTASYASAASAMSTAGHVSATSPMSTAGHVSAASPVPTTIVAVSEGRNNR
jgi:hypothetical protein